MAEGREGGEVLVRRRGGLGRLTLDRPRAIHALSIGMVDALANALDAWAEDERVRVVLIDATGERGFCAGGDIRALAAAVTAGRPRDAIEFMRREYRLDARIAAWPKPVVSLAHGITMGGGIGLASHARHRLVADGATLAMPETSIGLFPDVGATRLLSRAPGGLGVHFALTGARFSAADAVALGLADRVVAPGRAEALADVLSGCRDPAEVEAAIEAAAPAARAASDLSASREWADPAYAHHRVGAILAALDASASPDAAIAAAAIRARAPTSLAVTRRALLEARDDPDLATTLERDFRIAAVALPAPDFAEGVRAAMIDRDGAPAWSPARLADVTDARVDAFFAPHGNGLGLRPPAASPAGTGGGP